MMLASTPSTRRTELSSVLRIKRVETEQERLGEMALRHAVYCVEKGWVDPAAHPNGYETDEHDDFSDRFVAVDELGSVVGTMRLVHAHDRPMPLEKVVQLGDRPAQAAEMSRLAVARRYRKRGALLIMLALGQAIYRQALRSGVTHAYCLVERPLLDAMRGFGFPIEAVTGPGISGGAEVFGCVYPVRQLVPALRASAFPSFHRVADFFEDDDPGLLDLAQWRF